MKYEIDITDAALDAIERCWSYIAIDCRSPLNAERWLTQVFDAIRSLETEARLNAKAAESDQVGYEVRRVRVGQHFVLYTIDDQANVVVILNCRHGSRQPRPDEIP